MATSATSKLARRATVFEKRFIFLSVFDWQLRKGWDVLLKAYCQEFSPKDRTGLLVKITKLHGCSSDQVRQTIDGVLASIGQSLELRDDIYLLDATLDQEEMAALYRSVNAFVLPSRGEGWGRPYMEAMATALPTIGTRGSANEDFMNEDNSFLVDTVPVPVSEQAAQEIPVYRGHIWQEPDVGALRNAMRTVCADRKKARAVGRRAMSHMREFYSLSAGARVLDELILDVEQRLASQAAPPVQPEQIRVELEGEFFAGHSFSNINEQLAGIFAKDQRLALSLQRVYHNPANDRASVFAPQLRPYFDRSLGAPSQVVIRHAFPPNWHPPAQGRWVHIQPWEFGSLPREWVGPLRENVDEIWAPSNYVKNVYG